MTDLTALRARCAYWEKRYALEKTVLRRAQMLKMAWAEILRRAIHGASMAYLRELPALEQMVQHQFAVSLREIASPRKQSGAIPARAAGTRRSRATD